MVVGLVCVGFLVLLVVSGVVVFVVRVCFSVVELVLRG